MDEKRHENDLNKKEMTCSAHCYFDTSVCGSRIFFLFVSRSASRYGDIILSSRTHDISFELGVSGCRIVGLSN